MCDLSNGIDLKATGYTFTGWYCLKNQPTVHICEWTSVMCANNNIVGIALNGKDITGTITSILGYLSTLQFLDLSNNKLSGSFTLKQGQLLNMKRMYIQTTTIIQSKEINSNNIEQGQEITYSNTGRRVESYINGLVKFKPLTQSGTSIETSIAMDMDIEDTSK